MLRIAKEVETFEVADVDLPVPNGDPDVVYTLRPLTRAARKAIVEKNTRKVANPHTGRMDVVTDGEKVGDDLVDHVLVGWTGILYEGEPAPCERDLKLQIDQVRLKALIERAGLTQAAVEVAAAESFRGPA